MPEKYPDEKYLAAKHLLQEREALIDQVAHISAEIDRLKKLREQTRTAARRLKSSAIASELGVSASWVEKISEGMVTRFVK